jgi:hypothetical protein
MGRSAHCVASCGSRIILLEAALGTWRPRGPRGLVKSATDCLGRESGPPTEEAAAALRFIAPGGPPKRGDEPSACFGEPKPARERGKWSFV